MANGHVEIHDPFKGQNGITNSTEPTQKSTSNSESTEDLVEFRILMAYAKRRRPKKPTEPGQDITNNVNDVNTNGTPSPHREKGITEKKKKKKKKIWKPKFSKVLTCLKPQTDEYYASPCDPEEDHSNVMFRSGDQGDELEEIATRLTEISDEIKFVYPDLEEDSQTDNVEAVIGLLLREAGDRLNENELKNTNIVAELLGNYGFFEKVIKSLLNKMGLSTSNPETLGPKVSTKTQIAVLCEATSRLSVLDTLPVNRLLGHGARYLKIHYSSWAEQQGGYEKAFDSEDEDEVH